LTAREVNPSLVIEFSHDDFVEKKLKPILGHRPKARLNVPDTVNWVTFSPDGTLLGAASDNVSIWNTNNMGEIVQLTGHDRAAVCVEFLADGTRVATSDYSSIWLWNVGTGAQISRVRAHNSWVFGVVASPDKACIASVGNDATLRTWDAETLRSIASHTFPGVTECLAYSLDAAIIAIGCGATIRLAESGTLAEVAKRRVHKSSIRTIGFSPDQRLLASAGFDAVVKLVDATSLRTVGHLRGHRVCVWRAVFSPCGRYLVSAGCGGVVKVWNVDTCAEVQTVNAGGDKVLGAAFSACGRWFAAGGDNRKVLIWEVEI
jgi:WD40 repeat protein